MARVAELLKERPRQTRSMRYSAMPSSQFRQIIAVPTLTRIVNEQNVAMDERMILWVKARHTRKEIRSEAAITR